MTYYQGAGKHQRAYDYLYSKLVENGSKNNALGEILRSATVLYFDAVGNAGGKTRKGHFHIETNVILELAKLLKTWQKSLNNLATGLATAKEAESTLSNIIVYLSRLDRCADC